jgi:hypothetical protein
MQKEIPIRKERDFEIRTSFRLPTVKESPKEMVKAIRWQKVNMTQTVKVMRRVIMRVTPMQKVI